MHGARSHSQADPPSYSPEYLHGLSADELRAEGRDDGTGIQTPVSEEFARVKRHLAERGIVGEAADRALQAALDRHVAQTRREMPEERRTREYWGVVPRRRGPVRQRRAPAAIQRRRAHRERRPRAVRVARRRSTSSPSRDGPDDLDPSPAVAVAAKVIAAGGIHHSFAELRYLLGALPSPAEALQAFGLLPESMQTSAWKMLAQETENVTATETLRLPRAG
jgi:hypothetical protein